MLLRDTIFIYLIGSKVHQTEVPKEQVERFEASLKYPILGTVVRPMA
jgi:hypothetical protein